MTKGADPKSKTLRISLIPKPEWETKIRAFKDICVRNDLKMSDVLFEKVEAFLRKHNWPPGNSQTQIVYFSEGEYEPTPQPKYKMVKGRIECGVEGRKWVWRSQCVKNKCCDKAQFIIKDLEEQNRKNLVR